MDVPLALNDIGIRSGFKGYKRKSSTFCHQADVVGLFVYYIVFFAVGDGYNLQDTTLTKKVSKR